MTKTGTNLVTVSLKRAVVRGETEIKQLQLREPNSGEMRGISMVDLIQLKGHTVHELLPRITNPVLTDDEVKELCIADLFALSSEIANFLLPEEAAEASPGA